LLHSRAVQSGSSFDGNFSNTTMARRTRVAVLLLLRKRFLLFTILLAPLVVGAVDQGDLGAEGGQLSKIYLFMCWGHSRQALFNTHLQRYLQRERGVVQVGVLLCV